jgi:hypothetical protein
MSAVLDVSRPTPLRFLGFLFTAVGGLLIAWGAISDWATVVFQGQTFPASATPGVDVPEGKVALGLGILMLVAIVVMRIVSTSSARRAVALAICLAAALALAIGVTDVIRADERFGGYAVDRIAAALADASGQPADRVRDDVQAEVDRDGSIDIGLGLWLVIAGGAIGLVGGLLDLAWVGERRLREASSDSDWDRGIHQE